MKTEQEAIKEIRKRLLELQNSPVGCEFDAWERFFETFTKEVWQAAEVQGCKHKEADYDCPCFKEGLETADAENCFEKTEEIKELKKKVAEAKEETAKEIFKDIDEYMRQSKVKFDEYTLDDFDLKDLKEKYLAEIKSQVAQGKDKTK